MKTLKPLFDYVLIEPLEKENTLPSGIVIPDSAQEKPQEGKDIATGPGKTDPKGDVKEMTVQEGDVVMFKKWGGTEVEVNGNDYLLIKEDDLLAIVD